MIERGENRVASSFALSFPDTLEYGMVVVSNSIGAGVPIINLLDQFVAESVVAERESDVKERSHDGIVKASMKIV